MITNCLACCETLSASSHRTLIRNRRGLTLIELLLAITIMVLLSGVMVAMASSVHRCFEHGEGYGNATQHARVAIERITRMVSTATANATFPGVLVLSETEGTWTFPDILVVWHPTGAAANPAGLPLYQELVIYCPDVNSPNDLVEITVPGNTGVVPAYTATATWLTQIEAIRASATCQKTILTDLLATGTVVEASSSATLGNVRFESRLIPSQTTWTQYTQGTLTWAQLAWAQGVYGKTTGLRQVWVRMEMQVVPYSDVVSSSSAAMAAVPFFGSATLYYQLTHL